MARIDGCRSCGHQDLSQVLDLGLSPLADRLTSAGHLDEPEPRFPLEVAFCPSCGLLQITETVDPDVLFCQDYPYYSSFSDELVRHSRTNVLELIEARGLGADHLVIELASNDGYLLKHYLARLCLRPTSRGEVAPVDRTERLSAGYNRLSGGRTESPSVNRGH